jgi:predicted PhzF superfamily epimerase YddE/YHI9
MKVTGATVYGFHENNDEQKHIEVRSFAPAYGVNEDPVCGSGNGSVASFIRYYGIFLRKMMSCFLHKGGGRSRRTTST